MSALCERGIKVLRVKLDRYGYARDGRYWGQGEPLYYCPEVAEMRSPLFYSVAYERATDHRAARLAFQATISLILKGVSL